MIKKKDINKKSVPPLVSFVTPMKEKDFRVMKLIKSIRAQNYPQDKIEILADEDLLSKDWLSEEDEEAWKDL